MKFCAACHQDLPKDRFSKKQWKLAAQSQRRCTSCVQNNREVVQLPPSNVIESANSGIVSTLESMGINDNEMTAVSDEELFKQPPKDDDCPICFLCMPYLGTGQVYRACCGKVICRGCIYVGDCLGDQLCPFCRTPNPTSHREMIERYKKRMKMNDDAMAIYNLGSFYFRGSDGFTQSHTKALEYWHRAAKLGSAISYYNIGNAYVTGDGNGVERDLMIAMHYYGLAAIGGDVIARYNLGVLEKQAGNMDRALKHWIIAVKGGLKKSVDSIKRLYLNGHATKDDYANALRSYQEYIEEVKSVERDEAAAASDEWQYLLD